MTTQHKIDVEVDGMIVLAKLLEFREHVWTSMTVADFLHWTRERSQVAIEWLVCNEYAAKLLGSYLATEEGRQHYDDAVKKPVIPVSSRPFADEALTGVKQGGSKHRNSGDWQRSEITRAALPRGGPGPRHVMTTPEDIYLQSEEQAAMARREKQAAKMLSLTLDDFRRLLGEGLVKLCMGGGIGHLGRFHRKGKGTQHLCSTCMKAKRK